MAGKDPKRRDTDDMQDRLDRLDDGIRAARHQAQEHGMVPDPTPEPTFYDPEPEESGDEPKGTDSA